MHSDLERSPIKHNGTYFQLDMPRIVLKQNEIPGKDSLKLWGKG